MPTRLSGRDCELKFLVSSISLIERERLLWWRLAYLIEPLNIFIRSVSSDRTHRKNLHFARSIQQEVYLASVSDGDAPTTLCTPFSLYRSRESSYPPALTTETTAPWNLFKSHPWNSDIPFSSSRSLCYSPQLCLRLALYIDKQGVLGSIFWFFSCELFDLCTRNGISAVGCWT